MSSGQPVGNKAGWEWVEDGAKGATEDSGTVEQRKKTGGDSGANASRVCVCVQGMFHLYYKRQGNSQREGWPDNKSACSLGYSARGAMARVERG